MNDSTEKRDILDIVTENGQLQMALASEALGLVKAFIVEGEPLLDTKSAEAAVFAVYLNALNPAKMQSFKDYIGKIPGGGYTHSSLAQAIESNLLLTRKQRADEQRSQTQEMIDNLKAPTQKPGA